MTNGFQRLNLGITKCYLLECSGGYMLIDTAYEKDYDRFARALARLPGVDLCAIRYLLLTHHHDDHAGFAARLVEETGCRVIVHRRALLPLSKGESEDTLQPVNRRIRVFFALFEALHGEFRYPPLKVGGRDLVVDGDDPDLLRRIGIDGTILHTPGHSADSISVVLADGKAFVGDAAMNFMKLSGIRHRPIYVEDLPAVFDSWRKLIAHGARRIHPAHGGPFDVACLARSLETFGGASGYN